MKERGRRGKENRMDMGEKGKAEKEKKCSGERLQKGGEGGEERKRKE